MEYPATGRTSTDRSNLPNGEAIHNHFIKYFTATELTADKFFDLGKKEIARIKQQMEKVKNEVGYKGDLKSFFNHVRNKKELVPFNKPEQVINTFNPYIKMQPYVAQLFAITPQTPFEIKQTKTFREKSASAKYNPGGSKDGKRPGIFYIPIPDIKKYNIYSDEDLFLHEAIPGHRYQISLQMENKDLPNFRKSLWYSAYVLMDKVGLCTLNH